MEEVDSDERGGDHGVCITFSTPSDLHFNQHVPSKTTFLDCNWMLTWNRLRLKRPWIQQESNDSLQSVRDTRWILFLAVPQFDNDENLTSVLGCTTDISGFKFAEHMQMISRVEAEEAKRHQETFIDMTS